MYLALFFHECVSLSVGITLMKLSKKKGLCSIFGDKVQQGNKRKHNLTKEPG
jgi:hypothetical protein